MIGDRWGVTEDEVRRHFPCDDLVEDPVVRAWRGVTVHAAPRDVWPWVTQLRLAPYSYDWIDNLGQRSPRELRPAADPVPGDRFTASAGRPLGRIISVDPQQQLTGKIMGAYMSYVLVPTGSDTRLLLKIVMAGGRLLAPFVSVGDLVMARRQLINLQQLAERAAAPA